MSTPAPIPDGTYDAIVVDAEPSPHGPGVALELAILAGDHKGAVVEVTSLTIEDDPILLLGIPATLSVDDGSPTVTIEP